MSAWTRAAQINDDLSLRLEYSSGLALNQQHADEIFRAMVAGATPPTQLFSGPEGEVSSLLARDRPASQQPLAVSLPIH